MGQSRESEGKRAREIERQRVEDEKRKELEEQERIKLKERQEKVKYDEWDKIFNIIKSFPSAFEWQRVLKDNIDIVTSLFCLAESNRSNDVRITDFKNSCNEIVKKLMEHKDSEIACGTLIDIARKGLLDDQPDIKNEILTNNITTLLAETGITKALEDLNDYLNKNGRVVAGTFRPIYDKLQSIHDGYIRSADRKSFFTDSIKEIGKALSDSEINTPTGKYALKYIGVFLKGLKRLYNLFVARKGPIFTSETHDRITELQKKVEEVQRRPDVAEGVSPPTPGSVR